MKQNNGSCEGAGKALTWMKQVEEEGWGRWKNAESKFSVGEEYIYFFFIRNRQ